MSNYDIGYRTEHDLVDYLIGKDYLAFRAPQSKGIGGPAVDVIAIKYDKKKHNVLVFSVKNQARNAPFTPEEVYRAIQSAKKAGAKLYFLDKYPYKRMHWKNVRVVDIHGLNLKEKNYYANHNKAIPLKEVI